MKHIRTDRDLIDHVTLLIAVIAFIASVAIPVTFRILDQRSKIPDITISGRYLHRLSMDVNKDLIERVVNSWNLINAMVESNRSPRETYEPTLQRAYDHRLFRIKMTNRGDHPTSLSSFTTTGLTMSHPGKANASYAPGHSRVVAVSADQTHVDGLPIANLGPNETVSLDLVVTTIVFPTQQISKMMIEKTKSELAALGRTGVDTGQLRKTKCLLIPGQVITGGTTNETTFPILFSILEADFSSKGKLQSARIKASDHLGRDVTSSELIMEGTLAW